MTKKLVPILLVTIAVCAAPLLAQVLGFLILLGFLLFLFTFPRIITG